jgi:hypothetical protein
MFSANVYGAGVRCGSSGISRFTGAYAVVLVDSNSVTGMLCAGISSGENETSEASSSRRRECAVTL